jgi:hypothetical protein
LALYGTGMPITWTISVADRLVSARAQGLVTLQDVEALLDDLVVNDALPYRKLFDGRGSIGKYDDNDVMALAARISAYNNSLDLTGAAAIVVETQEHYDTALRFANIGQAKRAIRVFFSLEEARAWLDTDPRPGNAL